MSTPFRVIDTAFRPAREHIAFDQALVELHKTGTVPDTLRFLQFTPSVLIGRHQALAREVNLDYCEQHGIALARRLTGGGAIYMDEGQLGWELVLKRQSLNAANLAQVTQKICEAAAAGLSSLGIDARYRPFSDIEVDGRKLSGTGGFFDGDSLIYQGTVLMDMDPSRMLNSLRIPQTDADENTGEKTNKKAGDKAGGKAANQIVTLTELLETPPSVDAVKQALTGAFAEHLGIEAQSADITPAEENFARQCHDDEIGTDEFIHCIDDPASDPAVLSARQDCPGGSINAHIRLEGPGNGRVRQVLLSGDFFVAPGRTVLDLEASLRGVASNDVAGEVDAFFERTTTEIMSVKPADFRLAIESALSRAA